MRRFRIVYNTETPMQKFELVVAEGIPAEYSETVEKAVALAAEMVALVSRWSRATRVHSTETQLRMRYGSLWKYFSGYHAEGGWLEHSLRHAESVHMTVRPSFSGIEVVFAFSGQRPGGPAPEFRRFSFFIGLDGEPCGSQYGG